MAGSLLEAQAPLKQRHNVVVVRGGGLESSHLCYGETTIP